MRQTVHLRMENSTSSHGGKHGFYFGCKRTFRAQEHVSPNRRGCLISCPNTLLVHLSPFLLPYFLFIVLTTLRCFIKEGFVYLIIVFSQPNVELPWEMTLTLGLCVRCPPLRRVLVHKALHT